MTRNTTRYLALVVISLTVVFAGCSADRYARPEAAAASEGSVGQETSASQGTTADGSLSFDYAEVKWGSSGSGNRGIRIWVDGQRGNEITYKLSPNPHGNANYNKNASRFYQQVAAPIEIYYTNNKNWPDFGYTVTTKCCGTYSLVDPNS